MDVVLRMDTGDGFVPTTYGWTEAPEFTLYGDGTVVFRPAADPEGNGFPPFIQAHMTPEQMTELLAYALGPGGLAQAHEVYNHNQITDMPWTVFTVDTGDVDKSVAVYALSMTQPEGPDASDYESFQALGETLSHFGEQVAKGQYADVRPYQPSEYRAFLTPATGPAADAIPWPWPGLTLADFEPYGDHEGVLIGGLTPEQTAQVTKVPSGGVPAIAILGPDGAPLTLTVRPLLPGEPLDPLAPTGG